MQEYQKTNSVVNALELRNMNQVIIFDFDGVLADSLAPMLLYAGQVCRELEVIATPTKDDLEALERMEFSEFGRQLQIPEELIDPFVMRNHQLFFEREEPLPIQPGMEAVVAGLAEHNTVAVITGNSCKVVEKFLETYQIRNLFQVVLCAEHDGTRFEKILQVKIKFGTKRENMYMVGDAVSDIRAAREAGIKSIAVSWGHQSGQKLAQELPDLIVDEPEDLLAYFSEMVEKE